MPRSTIKLTGSIGRTVRGKIQRNRAMVANLAVKVWRAAVRASSLSPRAQRRYEAAIVPYRTRPGAYIEDKIAKLLETGWRPFDMKPGLLKGAWRKVIPVSSGLGNKPGFRAVSTNSPPESWKHPGFEGANLLEGVKSKLARLVEEAVNWDD